MPQLGVGLGMLISSLVSGGAAVAATKIGSRATNKAATLSTASANRSADIQAASNREAMTYAQKIEDTRKAEFDKTQALNLDQYNQREGRLAPYRDLGAQGVSTLDTLMRPGPGTAFLPPQARTGNTLMGAQ